MYQFVTKYRGRVRTVAPTSSHPDQKRRVYLDQKLSMQENRDVANCASKQ
jgi:hypothetical protein